MFKLFILLSALSLLGFSTHTLSENSKPVPKSPAVPKAQDSTDNLQPPKVEKKYYSNGEPLFFLDSKRRPSIQPFKTVNDDEFFLCRGTVSQWYRRQITEEFNSLAEKDNLTIVTGKNCALKLTKTNSGKKLPILTLEMFPTAIAMDHCVLGGGCPSSRYVILLVKDNILYRTFILNEPEMDIYKEYCLNNKGETLAQTSCWKYLVDKASNLTSAKK